MIFNTITIVTIAWAFDEVKVYLLFMNFIFVSENIKQSKILQSKWF